MDVFTIDNLKKVITVAAKIGSVGGKVYEDGKISFSDITHIPEFFSVFIKLIEVEWKQIVPEAKDLTQEEISDLISTFCEEFDIPQDSSEVKVEEILAIASQLISCIVDLIEVFKKKTTSVGSKTILV